MGITDSPRLHLFFIQHDDSFLFRSIDEPLALFNKIIFLLSVPTFYCIAYQSSFITSVVQIPWSFNKLPQRGIQRRSMNLNI